MQSSLLLLYLHQLKMFALSANQVLLVLHNPSVQQLLQRYPCSPKLDCYHSKAAELNLELEYLLELVWVSVEQLLGLALIQVLCQEQIADLKSLSLGYSPTSASRVIVTQIQISPVLAWKLSEERFLLEAAPAIRELPIR